MRLLSARDYSFREFHHKPPPYAILSHTWGSEEITYQDWLDLLQHDLGPPQALGVKNPDLKSKEGYRKIIRSCEIALGHGLEYVWIDTCCIDKTSSAELSEAINSMFQWYKQSVVCYAYLSDVVVPSNTNLIVDQGDGVSDLQPAIKEKLADSRWFSRGWTLQELIAPPEVLIFAQNWARLGTKTNATKLTGIPILNGELSEITGILPNFLRSDNLHHASVAQKMSWASRRETTRMEDLAYCLLGIFGVNMPLLYGEGERAFLRLQEEIIKHSEDHSIFAWDDRAPSQLLGPTYEWLGNRSGLLAPAPLYFDNAGKIVPILGKSKRPYAMTNTGLQIEFECVHLKIGPGWGERWVAILDCHYANDYRGPLAITIDLDNNSLGGPPENPLIASRRNLGLSPLVLDVERDASDSPKLLRLMTVPQKPVNTGPKLGIRPPRLFFETLNGPLPGWKETKPSGVQELAIIRAWPEQQFREVGELFATSSVSEASVLIAVGFGDSQPVCHAMVTAIRCPVHPNDHLRTIVSLVSDVTHGHPRKQECSGSQTVDMARHQDLLVWSYIGSEYRVGVAIVVVKIGVWKPADEELSALMHKHASSDAKMPHPEDAVGVFRGSLGLRASNIDQVPKILSTYRSRVHDLRTQDSHPT